MQIYTPVAAPILFNKANYYMQVRMQSYIEMQVFEKRWKDAAKKDQCWIDPYEQQANQTKTSH